MRAWHDPVVLIPSNWRRNKVFMRQAVLANHLMLVKAPAELRRDVELVCVALAQGKVSFATVDSTLRCNKSVVDAALRGKIHNVLRFAPAFADDFDVVMACLVINGKQLMHASERVKQNMDCARTAMTQNIQALGYMHTSLKDNKAFMLQCVSQNGQALQFASTRLMNDLDMQRTALLQCPSWFVSAAVNYQSVKHATYAPTSIKDLQQSLGLSSKEFLGL
jgi:hypothetical protein